MIASISGTLRIREAGRVVVETGGIGYEVFIPLSTYYRLPSIGTPVYLEIRQIVREDAILLYGFSDSTEKRAFDLLTGVQHVGPKLAQAILSVLSPGELAAAVHAADVARIDAVPGVGPKVAERVVRELRDKIGELQFAASDASSNEGAPMSIPTNGNGRLLDDAVSALVNLGVKPNDARRAVESVIAHQGEGENLEGIIRKTLVVLSVEK